jgi:hypothetical protein
VSDFKRYEEKQNTVWGLAMELAECCTQLQKIDAKLRELARSERVPEALGTVVAVTDGDYVVIPDAPPSEPTTRYCLGGPLSVGQRVKLLEEDQCVPYRALEAEPTTPPPAVRREMKLHVKPEDVWRWDGDDKRDLIHAPGATWEEMFRLARAYYPEAEYDLFVYDDEVCDYMPWDEVRAAYLG